MYISKNKNIFRHFKLEIALAIPASNDKTYNSNNSAGQGLLWSEIYLCTWTWLISYDLKLLKKMILWENYHWDNNLVLRVIGKMAHKSYYYDFSDKIGRVST